MERLLAIAPASSDAEHLVAAFESLVEAENEQVSALQRAQVLLARIRGAETPEALSMLAKKVDDSPARAMRLKYRKLYCDAGLNREMEMMMRRRKTAELVLLIVARLELWAQRKQEGNLQLLTELFESVSVLLVDPSVNPWLDLIDFAAREFRPLLPAVMEQVFEELEVEPEMRNKTELKDVVKDRANELLVDKKQLKTALKNEASSESRVAPKVSSLLSLRQREKKKKTARPLGVPLPKVIEKKISRKRMKSTQD